MTSENFELLFLAVGLFIIAAYGIGFYVTIRKINRNQEKKEIEDRLKTYVDR